jgi:hypothetical protein
VPVPVLDVLMNARSGRVPALAGMSSQVPSVSRAKVVPDSQIRVWKCDFWEAMWTSTVPVPVLLVLM